MRQRMAGDEQPECAADGYPFCATMLEGGWADGVKRCVLCGREAPVDDAELRDRHARIMALLRTNIDRGRAGGRRDVCASYKETLLHMDAVTEDLAERGGE